MVYVIDKMTLKIELTATPPEFLGNRYVVHSTPETALAFVDGYKEGLKSKKLPVEKSDKM